MATLTPTNKGKILMTLESIFTQFVHGIAFGAGFTLVAWGLKYAGVVVWG